MPHFYSLTLESQGSILSAIQGSYSAAKAHEIVVNKGRSLELLRLDVNAAQIQSICLMDTFSLVRNISNLRLIGSGKDLIVATSDSGNIVILDFNKDKNQFERIHSEPYGKSGCRRIVPGHYLAVDPMGRSVMIAAIERQKLVYTLTRKNKDADVLDISSPMEAHKSHMVCFSLVAMDVGFDNPMFATIEQSYSTESEELQQTKKHLIFWEVDLGLNYVSRKSSQVITESSHTLISVPGGNDGPSGVLVCDYEGIIYFKMGHSNIFCPYPLRFGDSSECGTMVVASSLHKLKGFFFILVQTELGDIYRVNLIHNEGIVKEMRIYYYDTIPVCNSLLVLRSGFLFASHEFGNHSNYQIISLGDDKIDPYTSSLPDSNHLKRVYFRPRNCQCIRKSEEIPSLSPITDIKVIDTNNDGTPQIVVTCGRGPRSTLRICSYGKNVEEIAENPLPGRPRCIWTLKNGIDPSLSGSQAEAAVLDNIHHFIIISFIDRSLVLTIGEHVEETNDTLFTLNETTMYAASMIFYNSFLQVLETHVKLIIQDRIYDWKTPDSRKIVAADSNGRQVSLALEGGLIVVLELSVNGVSGITNTGVGGLVEVCRREITCEIICIGIQQLSYSGQLRSDYVVVGTSTENALRLYKIDSIEKRLKQTCTQILPNSNSIPENVQLYHSNKYGHLILFVGLTTGVILSCKVDASNGSISDPRSKYLGNRGVNICRVMREDFGGEMSLVCMSTRPWLVDSQTSGVNFTPLQYRCIDSIAPLNTHQVSNGYVAVSGSTLLIFQVTQGYGESFSQSSISLSYTPRKLLTLPSPQLFTGLETLMSSGTLDIPKNQMVAIVETDHNSFDFGTKKEIISALQKLYNGKYLENDIKMEEEKEEGEDKEKQENDLNVKEDSDNLVMDIAQDEVQDSEKTKIERMLSEIRIPGENGTLLAESEVGGFVAGEGKWGGCVRIINLKSMETIQLIPLDTNEGCISACVCKFDELELPCLVLGTVYGMKLNKRYNNNKDSDLERSNNEEIHDSFGATIKIYKYDSNYNFELVHVTPVENAATAITGWRGRLLVGINKTLRVYSLGKKRLLRKSEFRSIPQGLTWIKVVNDRIFAGDISNGVLVFKFNNASNQFILVAKDPMSRWLTSACEILDYHTIAVSDKFDNIIVSRVPVEASDDYSFVTSFTDNNNNPSSTLLRTHQINTVAQFHLGDIVTCLQKSQLTSTSTETIVYGTVLGSIGSLSPIVNIEDLELLSKLEILLRKQKSSLLSRDHLMFRSYYSPVHNVIDGDFCQTFSILDSQTQTEIASKLDVTVEEIYKKLDDYKTRLF
ncbi:splicing factor 3b [Cryptosporidium sp. chipmunk genotype I]|uniref:splicing factor 3b n=1 Tax=Cryptosporidium sp. chipmunk genotype I TaxID=1280935 RepID=UPI00351A6C47|nr:splicing factor 3b [Cryptosporidium sp. chipmunk genotype I]